MKLFGLVVLTARQYREERDADTAVAASLIVEELDRVRMELDKARMETVVLPRINMFLNEQVADLTAKLAALREVKAEPEPAPKQQVQIIPEIPAGWELCPPEHVLRAGIDRSRNKYANYQLWWKVFSSAGEVAGDQKHSVCIRPIYSGPAYQEFLSSAVEEFRRKFLAANRRINRALPGRRK